MKKIAFMFAAAAMAVACTEAPKTATPEQVDSIYSALKAAAQQKAEEIQVEYNILVEGTEDQIDSAACVAAADAAKAAIIEAADTTNEAFKAEFEAAVKAFEAALNAPAEAATAE